MNKGVLRKVAAAAAMIAVFLIAVPAVGAIGTVDEDEVSCNAAMLVDQYTGEVLYQKNADEKIRPASTTKIMTAVLAMEAVENGLADDFGTLEDAESKAAELAGIGSFEVVALEPDSLYNLSSLLGLMSAGSSQDLGSLLKELEHDGTLSR